MQRHAFKMKLLPGVAAEYKKRHDEIWPDLVKLHSDAGISDYSIYLDEETNTLFAFQQRIDHHCVAALPDSPLMRKWWDYMQDLMVCHPDGAPVAIPLLEVFHMD
jgi:L-rhamnose mutarotase